MSARYENSDCTWHWVITRSLLLRFWFEYSLVCYNAQQQPVFTARRLRFIAWVIPYSLKSDPID
jgi:hypothetical protein